MCSSDLYETTQDVQLGIHFQRDAAGRPIWHPVYMVAWYIWGGIDIGGTIPVENPCNWSSAMDLPAPWLLDTAGGTQDYEGDRVTGQSNSDAGVRRTGFSFLGVARTHKAAPVWPSRFHHPTGDAMTAVAQAKLFNHTSWDLWTQDWQVQLAPVSQWQEWMDRMDRGVGDADGTRGMVLPQDVRDAWTYLRKFRDLADGYMTH